MNRNTALGYTHYVLMTAVAVLAATWALPRVLLGTLGMENPWTSYFYLYGFGGMLFLVGIYLILRTRACQLGRGHDTFWFKVLIFGYCFYAFMHAAWTLLALYVPVKGGI